MYGLWNVETGNCCGFYEALDDALGGIYLDWWERDLDCMGYTLLGPDGLVAEDDELLTLALSLYGYL